MSYRQQAGSGRVVGLRKAQRSTYLIKLGVRVRVPRERDPGCANPVYEEDFPETATPSQDPGRENRSVAALQPPQRVPRFHVIRRNDHSRVQRLCPAAATTNQSDKHKRYPNPGDGRRATQRNEADEERYGDPDNHPSL